eukprot:TRINITY_DN110580_c0_g1_i1.p1 TRINITY_DN110580_c0_g1~~TRINITY_DN110580_c0_g1_i1.p1  ORF type:complete len:480 (-),score=116.74 TRINITY_DN110580_c0_g1_i1:165-1523(-)
MAFSDDAFNKQLIGSGAGAGTLIGNWCEERELRDSSGEGRSVPQRHLPRRDLLKEWTKVPPKPRLGDDTFDRVYGPRGNGYAGCEAASKTIGKVDESRPNHVRVGPLEKTMEAARFDQAEAEVQAEEEILAELARQRNFETSQGAVHTKPDFTLTEKAQGKKSCKMELLRGTPPDRIMGLANDGLEVQTQHHYTQVEQVTHQRMCLADPRLRNDVQASAARGVGPFHRNSEFTKKMEHFQLGLIKDDAMADMFAGLSATNPLRDQGGTAPLGGKTYADVPSLTALKEVVHLKIAELWGPHGYILLRQRLFETSNHEGFVQKSDVVAVIREQLGITTDQVADKPLTVWLDGLCTMKKGELRVGTLMSSLRPSLSQKEKRAICESFRGLQSPSGTVRLGDWLARLEDDSVKQTVIAAFGAEDEESVADTGVSEQVFLELFSDLAPLSDISPLLV